MTLKDDDQFSLEAQQNFYDVFNSTCNQSQKNFKLERFQVFNEMELSRFKTIDLYINNI